MKWGKGKDEIGKEEEEMDKNRMGIVEMEKVI